MRTLLTAAAALIATSGSAAAQSGQPAAGDAARRPPPPPPPITQAAPEPAENESAAGAEARGPVPIQPANALEHTFVAALTNAEMRPVFRRMLLESQVALALDSGGEEVRTVPIQGERTAAAIFTSPARLRVILGADAPFEVMTGRAALARVREGNVAINIGWAPMLTLEPEDIAQWLEAPDLSSATRGPSQ